MKKTTLASLRNCIKNRNDINFENIKKAFLLAKTLHEGQKRKSGEPYFVHPAWIAQKLCELGADEATIIAGFLHDTVEDTKMTLKEIERLFGKSVSKIVKGLTKLSKFKYRGSIEERNIDNFCKMMLLAAKDFRVILVKLVDRLHNLETIQFLPTYKQKRIARETMGIYVPMASLLGVWEVMVKLENYSFKISDRKNYDVIDGYFYKCQVDKKYILENAKKEIVKTLNIKNIKNNVDFFIRRKYSFFRKSENLNIFFSEVNYPIGFNIIVEDEEACYQALHIIHKLFKPRFDKMQDYISRPKKNGYQAFHTWVYMNNGEICCCVKIFSKEMDKQNNFGIFSQLRNQNKFSIEFIDKIIASKNRSTNKKSLFEEIKTDILQEKIHVFNSEGKVYDLPKGSTVLDFAFSCNVKTAPYCNNVLQNGIEVSIFAPLFAGDTIQFKNSHKIEVTSDWLYHVNSTNTKSIIKQILETQEYKKNIESGEGILNKKLKWINLSTNDSEWDKYFNSQKISKKQLLKGIGDGSIDEVKLISKFLINVKKIKQTEEIVNNKKYKFFKVSFRLEKKSSAQNEFDLLTKFNIKILKLKIQNILPAKSNKKRIIEGEFAINKICHIFHCFEQLAINNKLFTLTFIK